MLQGLERFFINSWDLWDEWDTSHIAFFSSGPEPLELTFYSRSLLPVCAHGTIYTLSIDTGKCTVTFHTENDVEYTFNITAIKVEKQ